MKNHLAIGLGLPISKKLIDLMKGEIGTSSPASGGNCLWSPPLDTTSEGKDIKRTTSRTAKPQPPSRNLRLLVAEDSAVNAQVRGLMLDKRGYSHIRVEDGIKAYQAVMQQRFGAVLMGMQMPNMNGITATKKIHESNASVALHQPTSLLSPPTP